MSSFAASLLVGLVRTTLVLAGVGIAATLLLRIARIQSPTLHRLACCLTLLIGWMLVRVPVEVPWYAAEVVQLQSRAPLGLPFESMPVEALPVEMQPTEDLAAAVPTPPSEISLPHVEAGVAPSAVAAANETGPTFSVWSSLTTVTWPSLVVAAWAIGMLAICAGWLLAYVRFVWRLPPPLLCRSEWQDEWSRIQAEQGAAPRIALRVTQSLGPLLCRLPRGAELLVPNDLWQALGRDERQAILRHELAHHQRRDVWKSLAMRVLALPHWFNPVAWLAVRRFDEAAEWACDRAAMGDEPTVYARMLLRLGELASTRAPLGSAMSNLPLTNRIRRLLALETKEDSAMKKALLLSLMLLVVPLASVRVRLVAEQPERAKETPTLVAPKASLPAAAPPASKEVASPYEKPAAVRAAERKMVETAKKAFEATNFAYQSGNTTLDPLVAWSTRWLAAELAVGRTREEQVTAARAHLERIQELHKSVAALYASGSRGGDAQQMETLNYYLADAERRLAEIEAAPAGSVQAERPESTMAALPEGDRQTASTPLPPEAALIIGNKFYKIDSPELVPALKKSLRHGTPNELLVSIGYVRVRFTRTDGSILERMFPELAPDLIELLGHEDRVVRDRAEAALLSIRSSAEADLEKAAATSSNPEIAMRAKRLLAQTEPTPVPPQPNSPFQLLSRAPKKADATEAPQHGRTQADLEIPTTEQGRDLRYDGKTFAQWKQQLQTDLSPALRKEAMFAMAEFAAHGYGNQVATIIFEASEGFPPNTRSGLEKDVQEAALYAAMRVPPQELIPFIEKALTSNNVELRRFAIQVVPIEPPQPATIPLLVNAMNDAEPVIAAQARALLSRADHGNPELAAWLRTSLAAGNLAQISPALQLVLEDSWRMPLDRQFVIAPFVDLLPDALALTNHPEEGVRDYLKYQIQHAASHQRQVREALRKIESDGGPQSEDARKLLGSRLRS